MHKKIIIAAALLSFLGSSCAYAYDNISVWAVDEVKAAADNGLIGNISDNADMSGGITRAELAGVAVSLYEQWTGTQASYPQENPFSDTYEDGIMKAYKLGIVNGVSEHEFAPAEPVTREQAAKMLSEAYFSAAQKKMPMVVADKFDDDAMISAWARNYVYFMEAEGIVKGVGDGMFMPEGNIERQQAAAMANRLFEKYRTYIAGIAREDVESGNTGTEISLINLIPHVGFGTIISEDTYKDGAQMRIDGVTYDDYLNYRTTVLSFYPDLQYELEGTHAQIVANNEEYNIRVEFSGDAMLITIAKK